MNNLRSGRLWFRVMICAILTGFSPSLVTADEICDGYLQVEANMNRELPRQIDEATELVQFRVNCALESITLVKRILVDLERFAPGWLERKQRQHQQLNCNQDGAASVFGWTVRDQIVDRDSQYVTTFVTTADDCDTS